MTLRRLLLAFDHIRADRGRRRRCRSRRLTTEPESQNGFGIDVEPAHLHPPVEVRTGDASGLTDQPQDVAALHLLTDAHPEAREVEVDRIEAGTVADYHRASGVITVADQRHLAVVGGGDGLTFCALDVIAVVLALLRTVEDPPLSEVTGERCLSRPDEAIGEDGRAEFSGEGPAEGRLVTADALFDLGWRGYEARFDRESGRSKLRFLDGHLGLQRFRGSIDRNGGDRHLYRERPRLLVHAESNQCLESVGDRIEVESAVAQHSLRCTGDTMDRDQQRVAGSDLRRLHLEPGSRRSRGCPDEEQTQQSAEEVVY